MEIDLLSLLQKSIGQVIQNSPSHFMNWLEPRLLAAEKGSLTCSYIIRQEMTNPYQILHGGITAGIIDDLIGATVYTLGLPKPFITVNNNIDYFAPVKMGETIIARTQIIKQGRSIINLQCEVMLDQTERLIARGTSNMMAVGH